jgi:secretion/DNA translocation related TadE-like protein
VTRERGAATLLVGACLSLLLVLGAALGVVVATVLAHRVAQSAADLAALGGASAAGRGADGCAAARELAVDNGARLVSCRVEGRDVVVSVSVAAPRWLGQSGDLGATARAGPHPSAAHSGSGGGVLEQQVQQGARGVLVQRLVLVAALG